MGTVRMTGVGARALHLVIDGLGKRPSDGDLRGGWSLGLRLLACGVHSLRVEFLSEALELEDAILVEEDLVLVEGVVDMETALEKRVECVDLRRSLRGVRNVTLDQVVEWLSRCTHLFSFFIRRNLLKSVQRISDSFLRIGISPD